MSTPAPDPNAGQPTPQDAAAVGAAAAAANEATPTDASLEQRLARIEAAVSRTADARGFQMSDEDKRQVAQMTVAMMGEDLERRGAFDQPPPPPPAAAQPAAADNGGAPAENGGAGGGDQAPRPKRSFAEWFQGKT